MGSSALSSGSYPLRISPLKEGVSFPLTISVGLDLGFAYWPAILAILFFVSHLLLIQDDEVTYLTTGLFDPQIRTKLI